MSSPEPPIIDAHCHVFTSAMPFTDNAWARPDYEYPVERYLADLDRHGVSFGVITAASLYGDYNDYTLSVLDRYDRLRATVMLDLDTSPQDMARLYTAGVRGVRFQIAPSVELPDLEGYRFRRFVTRLADANLHLELNLSGPQLSRMIPSLAKSGVKIVVDHFGLLRSEDGMEGAGFRAALSSLANGRTWIKVSAGFRLPQDELPGYAARLLAEAGPERLLWGSDAPYVGCEDTMDYGKALALFYRIVPDAAVRRAISDTGLRLYFF
ncbi:amidohydrolase family protein [Novosphingobium aquimarinum]|uniref:amidohydrolase family protein n=1 Tax=Novosphingobium aquimarinum TaxID=2682494 RepID=UPI0012EC5DEF|nr:amidohydrolase family protein [Novosphingobium aquimarinum]